MAKEVIIGIDLGTTNSEAAHLEGGRPVIIPSSVFIIGENISKMTIVISRH